MPLQKLQFKPGVNTDVTSYSAEGGWVDGDKVRFRLGYPEKIGGWLKYSTSQFLGVCRALHNWVALDGSNFLGLGTHLKYYIEEGGAFNDITPIRSTTSAGEIFFTATDGSSVITVTDANHGANTNDFVTFSNSEALIPSSGIGNITAAVLNQEYQIAEVVDGSTYKINAKDPVTGAAVVANQYDAGPTATGGGRGLGNFTISGTAAAASGINTVTVGSAGTGVGALTFANPSGTGVGNFTISGASTGSATTTGVVQTSTSGSGTSAEFTVVASSGDYTVTVTNVGSGYAVGDTILIEGQNIGGTQTTNDLTLTITHLQGASVGTATHTGETQTATSGSGSNAQFTVTTDGNGNYSVAVTAIGSGYAVNDTITIAGTGIGGTSPANDLVLTVTQLSGTSIGTRVETGVTQASTSGSGSNAEFTVVNDGSGGYSVVVTNKGTGYAANDTITISGASVGGTTPANDFVITVSSLISETHTDVGGSGYQILVTPPNNNVTPIIPNFYGSGARFEVTRDGNGVYTVTKTASGVDYQVNNIFTIRGGGLGGSNGTNDLTITVTSLETPTIANYQINAGLNSQVGGTGWGAGTWGRDGWGESASGGLTTVNEIRLWSHDNFGEDLIINPRDSRLYYWDKTGGLGTRAVEVSTRVGARSVPTVAKQVLVSDQDRHVIAFGCDAINSSSTAAEGNGVQDPLLVRFSSQENAVDWFPTDTNTAGDLILGSGSKFVQAVETKREILVWTDTSLHSMRFIGPPFTFGLQQLASNITIMGPNAAVATEDVVYWMGIDNFYVYSGQTQQLECTVKDHVFTDFNLSQTDKVYGGINSEFSEVIWLYCSDTNSVANGGSGENDRYVIYNYKDSIWYYGTFNRSAWLDRGTRTYPIAAESGYLYNHEFEFDDDGSPMNSYIESAPMDIADGDKFSLATTVIPDLTFSGSTSLATPQATFTLKARTDPGAAYNSTSSGTTVRTASAPVETFTERLNLRVRGRTFAVRVESAAQGTKWKLGSPRIDIRPDGRR